MKTILSIFAVAFLLSCSSPSSEEFSLKNMQSKNPEISTLQNGTGFEQQVLQIKPTAENQSLVVWEEKNPHIWTEAKYLVCEIWHPNDFSAVLNVEFFRNETRAGNIVAQSGDLAGDAKETPRMAAKIGVLPHLKTKVIFPLEHLNGQEIFMPRFPRQLKGTVLGSRLKPEDISKVAIRFAPFQNPHFLPEFEVAAVYLTKELPVPFPAPDSPVVDQFGQWTAKNWPGKTTGEEDLKNLLESQLANASSSTFPEKWSKYGGWKAKQFEATGFFRTHHDGNRWWLADPEGYAFVSVGVDCIRDNATGVISGQEDLLQWIPDKNDPVFKEAFSGRGDMVLLDYYKTNLMRIFGESWRENWETITSGQIREFRLNTIANWSDIEYARKAQIPYVLPLSGFPSTEVKLFRDFPDVFAAQYLDNAKRFGSQLEAFKGDPYLIGYFLRNEPHWAFGAHDIAFEMFATAQQSESKHTFARWLSTQYPNIGEFNQKWNL
ncbi:MAG: hypothetical protein K0B11_21280, partial [Mariniphaga sp.]|nr:hypothetical protein [Mariniphaga sp.]